MLTKEELFIQIMMERDNGEYIENIVGMFPSDSTRLCPVHLEFSDNFEQYRDLSVEIEGILSRITPPKDYVRKRLVCPNCGGFRYCYDSHENKVICAECDSMSDGTPWVMEKKDSAESLQILRFKHPIYSKELIVTYAFHNVEKTELTKRDLGKSYRVRGIMIVNDQDNLMIHSDDLELITPDDEDTVELVGESRDIPGYDEWRKEVLSRDKHCVVCGGDKHLHVHHLYGYKEYPDLRVDVNNGVTVCKFCHERYHSYYGLSDITPDKFIQFMRRFGVR